MSGPPTQIEPLICPVCKSKIGGFEFISNFKSDTDDFSLFECRFCRVQFWSPFKNPGPEWYKNCEQNLRHRDVVDKDFFLWMARNRKINKYFLNALSRAGIRNGKLLDVGCGTGGFLVEAKRAGFNTIGIDFDENQINTAKNYGLTDVYSDDILNFLNKHNDEYDVITGLEIIEHLDNPKEFLEAVFKSIKIGGYFCLSTPNRSRIGSKNEFWDFPYHHLTRWNKSCLLEMAKTIGFKSISIREELPIDYIISKLRLGLGVFIRKLIKSKNKKTNMGNAENPKNEYKDIVSKFGALKDKVLSVVFGPIAVILFIASKKGQGLYLTARK
ncbi:MAG: 2-polyprenyl-3-methyl-5-hydroxy-6-metoxy-1,4-benzoquinol methylase [Parcubacteria group bacterium Licking1014_17]|nr:MAG: 2-polyprenyl-3-methyl-5-hydroxy-6-metoxy-1,4-benzoquinol methylase [Parcubacteria group bacterium Licking1014_17]